MERLQTSNVSISNGSREEFKCKFTKKNDFPIGYFIFYAVADADIGSLKALYTCFGKYLEYMLVKFKRNRMV